MPKQAARTAFRPRSFNMNLNYTSPGAQMPTQRSTSFFIEDILLHKPKPLRDVFPSPFSNSLASRMPLLEYGYPLMPTPILASHPHHPLHKPEHHPYFFTSGKNSPSVCVCTSPHYTGDAVSNRLTLLNCCLGVLRRKCTFALFVVSLSSFFVCLFLIACCWATRAK